MNDALMLKTASDACRDSELPVKLTAEYNQIFEIMKEGGDSAIAKAKSVMRDSGVNEQCIEIFGMVCSKAQEYNALEIVKEACANLWV